MKYDPAIHNRRSIRLKGYDYSQAGYILLPFALRIENYCSEKIDNDEMILNDAGKMIETEWKKLQQRFSSIELHEFAVMPNHVHGILEIVTRAGNAAQDEIGAAAAGTDTLAATRVVAPNNPVARDDNATSNDLAASNDMGKPEEGATTRVASVDKTVGDMMGAFKSITTVEYINGVKNLSWQPFNGKLWQRDYHEHIIRNEHSYENIADYIINNPARWRDDKFYIA